MPREPDQPTDSRPPPLRVVLTRITNDRHRFEARRADGSTESVELETKSCLLHDLVHFAIESEAGLRRAFYGLLQSGVRYDALQHDVLPADAIELWQAEQVVGPLQTAWRQALDAKAFVARLRDYDAAVARESPPWLDEHVVTRACERLRQLDGRWRATAFGDSMELCFDVPDAAR
jgi:hypothetical protein